MPFLTELGVKLMREKYNISKSEAERRYLETTGLDFASQLELFFLKDNDFAKDKKINFIGISMIFDRIEFKKRGALSVSCLADLAELFDQSEKYFKSLEEVK